MIIKASNDIKDYANFLGIIRKWFGSLLDLKKDSEGDALFVAIARKAPKIIFSQERETNETLPIISEIALPFLSSKQYSKVVALDDSIYYGTTFDKVEKLISAALKFSNSETLGKSTLIAAPISISSGSPFYSHIEEQSGKIPVQELEERQVPFYINSIIDLIHYHNNPYDIEVPIFSFVPGYDLDEDMVDAFVGRLVDKINDRFFNRWLVESYKTVRDNYLFSKNGHPKRDISYSIPLDEIFDKPGIMIKPDIAKIRITFNRRCINISSYCICSLFDKYLTKDSIIFSNEVNKEVWNPIVSALNLAPGQTLENQDILFDVDPTNKIEILCDYGINNNLYREWFYHCKKSLAIVANYILSYYLFSKVKGIIESLLGTKGALNKKDIDIILGHELSSGFMKALKGTNFDIFSVPKRVVKEDVGSIIPREYKLLYEGEYADDVANSKSDVENSFSALFGAMHRKIELKTRSLHNWESLDSFNRLRFGESFSSLVNRQIIFQFGSPLSKIKLDVNKALDSRIDQGSVVPNYLLQGSIINPPFWSRHFRAGENDDRYRDQYLRNLVYVLKLVRKGLNSNFVTRNQLDFVLLILAKKFPLRKFLGADIVEKYKEFQYQAFLECGNGEIKNIVDWAIDSRILSVLDDNLYVLSDSAILQDLYKGNILTKEEEETISSIIGKCIEYIQDSEKDKIGLQTILSVMYFGKDRTELLEGLATWQKEFFQFVKTEDARILESVPELLENIRDFDIRFFDYYLRFPFQGRRDNTRWIRENHLEFVIDEGEFENYKSLLPSYVKRFIKSDCAIILLLARYGYYHSSDFPEQVKNKYKPSETSTIELLIKRERLYWTDLMNYPNGIEILRHNVTTEEFLEILDKLFASKNAYKSERDQKRKEEVAYIYNIYNRVKPVKPVYIAKSGTKGKIMNPRGSQNAHKPLSSQAKC